MIVLDTNVISELMRPIPYPAVLSWVAARPRSTLYTTSINQVEILYGIAALPAGRRRRSLEATAQAIFTDDFAGRILPLESAAAAHYAEIVTTRRRSGHPIEAFDALIAAAALAAGATIATRDVTGFAGCGLVIVDPWMA